MKAPAWARDYTVVLGAALAAAFALLALTPLGGYLEANLHLEPLFKLRALVGREPKLDPRVRLIVADDRSLKKLGEVPTFEDWQRVAALLFAAGYDRVLLQEPQNLAGQVGDPGPKHAHGALAVAVVDTLGARSSRAVAGKDLPADLLAPGVATSDEGRFLDAGAFIAPDEATWGLIDRVGLNNVDDGTTVPLAARTEEGRLVPHLSLLALDGLRWSNGRFVARGAAGDVTLPNPSDGRYVVDFLSVANVVAAAVPVAAFFEDDHVVAAIPPKVMDRLAGGKIAVLVPAAYSGSRYVVSPIEGTVPAYLSLVSMINSALANHFLYKPLPFASLALAAALLVWLALRGQSSRRRVQLVVGATLATPVAGTAALHLAGWYLPCAQLCLLAGLGLLLRGAEHFLQTLTERTKLAQDLALGSTVQQLLLPAERRGRIGPWEFAVAFRPHAAMAGDWFQIFQRPARGDRPALGLLAIGDVVGKGPSAALITAAIASVWHEHAALWEAGPIDLDRLFRAWAGTIHRTFRGRQYTTLSLVMVTGDELRFASIAAPPWLRGVPGTSSGRVKIDPTDPLGMAPDPGQIPIATATPEPGEVFLAHSDGVLDSAHARKRFLAGLKEPGAAGKEPLALVERLAAEADQGDSLPDDVTLLVLRHLGEAASVPEAA